ncbi:DctP family TRAP transporter solute-binding subunit [Oceanobacillus salinisoli]|uniref:DctP family TRAP transporter solute-binding subunit n=1 Tax=Oceanobacillus salinisoli TaxID=2678611 RepID=UPI001E285EA0|nr:DctP family TRAP transporter solute-binding subunit [Oceanobacillus salinisoli]
MTVLEGLLKKIILHLVIICTAAFLVSCSMENYPVDHEQLSEEERIVIRFSHVVGEDTPKGLASRRFAELVEERTDGFVEVQVFPNSFLYRDGEELDALLKGDVQMIAPATSKIASVVKEWQVMDLPFAFESAEEVKEYISSPVGKVLTKKLEQEGMYFLSFWDNGFKQMTNNQRPLYEPEDFKNLTFRIMESEVLEEQFHLLGAVPHVETFDQVFPILEKGELQAQENTFSNIVNKNIHSVQDYMTVSNHGYLGYLVIMNAEFWQGLPDEIQIILLDVLQEVTEWEAELAEEVNQEKYEFLNTCHCIEIHQLSEKEKLLWEEALNPLYDSYVERFGAEYIDFIPKFKE